MSSSNNVVVYDWEVFPNYAMCGFMPVHTEGFDDFKTFEIGNYKNEVSQMLHYIQGKWLVGYNSRYYDNQLIEFLKQSGEKFRSQPEHFIANRLYKLSSKIIEDGYSEYRWNISFNAIDLMRVGNIDKSLKLVGVDLKWWNTMDLIRPHDLDVTPDEIEGILFYNWNDCAITKLLYKELRDDINMRKKLSIKYGVDLMDYADSGMADRLLEKFYSQATGLSYWDFKNQSTERSSVLVAECIPDTIYFQTDKMKDFLEDIKSQSISPDSKFENRIIIGDTHYDMLKGGLHSVREPEIFEEDDEHYLLDVDVSSYYPNHMINYVVKPEHLRKEFLDVLADVLNTRLEAKYSGDKPTDKGLKITVNSVFGKMGYPYSWLYDLKAMYSVTIPCQLAMLMLIEKLEMYDISVVYGNTDGITVRVHKEKLDRFNKICSDWQEYTEFELDYEEYKKAVIRDVNNYIIFKKDGEVKMKGAFDTERWKDFGKGYEYPVVPIAVREHFEKGIPVEETITSHSDILDFCMAQKVGGKFDVYYYYSEDGELKEEKCQKTNRYYIGKGGGSLVKRKGSREIRLVAGQPVKILNKHDEDLPIDSYEIKYEYYIRETYKLINEFSSKQMGLF